MKECVKEVWIKFGFEREVRQEPQNRDRLSEVYQLLKRKCWEVGLFGNG